MNLFQQFSWSIWNFKGYKALSKTNGGKSFLYIFLLFLIFYIVLCSTITIGLVEGVSTIQSALEEDMPDFKLSNGKFTFYGEMPYRVEGNGSLLIIDTTGQTTEEDLISAEGITSGLLITEDELISYDISSGLETQALKDLPIELDKDTIINFIPNLKLFVNIGMAIWFIFAFGGKLFAILILALIAMLACAIFNQGVNFKEQWNTAIYASTVPILLKLIHTAAGYPMSGYFFVIYWIVSIAYVFLAVYYISREPKNEEPAAETEAYIEA